jgi:ABC-type multidrug transport system fused ATPase/permease subunit
MLGETMTNFITSWTSLEVSLGAIARIEAFEKDMPVEAEVKSPVRVSTQWPISGAIRFDNVWASYDPHSKKPNWSLRGISFQIHPGEKIAICGRSGSGKSTLLLSLLALIETHRGIIAIDDVDISGVKHSILRSRFHVISQDTFSQGETPRDALDPEGSFSDEALTNTLGECAILDKIRTSGGLSAKLTEVNFSAGEAQRFALARTILEGGIDRVVLFSSMRRRAGKKNQSNKSTLGIYYKKLTLINTVSTPLQSGAS